MKDKLIKIFLDRPSPKIGADRVMELLKEEGWIHEDDPVEELEVVRKQGSLKAHAQLTSTEIELIESEVKSPLTIGELLQMAKGMVMVLHQCWLVVPESHNLKNVLTTSDGGVLTVKEPK